MHNSKKSGVALLTGMGMLMGSGLVISLLTGCAPSPPVYGNYYTEKESGGKKFAVLKPVSLEISLPDEDWRITRANSFRYLFSKYQGTGVEQIIDISIMNGKKLGEMTGTAITDPINQYLDFEASRQLNSSLGFKQNSRDLSGGVGYLELESEQQFSASLCWMEGEYLVAVNYVFGDKGLYERQKVMRLHESKKVIDVKEFNAKMKSYYQE